MRTAANGEPRSHVPRERSNRSGLQGTRSAVFSQCAALGPAACTCVRARTRGAGRGAESTRSNKAHSSTTDTNARKMLLPASGLGKPRCFALFGCGRSRRSVQHFRAGRARTDPGWPSGPGCCRVAARRRGTGARRCPIARRSRRRRCRRRPRRRLVEQRDRRSGLGLPAGALAHGRRHRARCDPGAVGASSASRAAAPPPGVARRGQTPAGSR